MFGSGTVKGFLNKYHSRKTKLVYSDNCHSVYYCDCPICQFKNVFLFDDNKNIKGKTICSHYWQYSSFRKSVNFIEHVCIG